MRRSGDPDGPTLESRLLRFLEREEADERRAHDELRALPVDDRVLEGECIRDAVLERAERDAYLFRVEENLSKFREGDAVAIGDGLDFEGASSLVYARYDAQRHALVVERDRFARGEPVHLEVGRSYVVDRRPLGLRGRLREVVRAGFADERIAAVLEGRHEPARDDGRLARAEKALASAGLNDGQVAAGAAAIGTESLALVQGPPGTGKTRLLAEVLRALCGAGCRIALSAFTHRAVDNVLFALRALDGDVPLAKVGNPGPNAVELRRAGVQTGPPRRIAMPRRGVVAGTPFGLAKLPGAVGFHYAVFDEAGQMPVPHAIAGMLLAKRWLFFGDHRQLPPVVTAHHADGAVARSVFEHLHERYGSHLLDTTYRMNAGVCDVIGRTFYDGRLRAAPGVAERRMAFVPGGGLDDVLDPEAGVVIARIDHLQPGMRSHEEAELCADLVSELVRRHGIPPAEIAVIAPFRAQVRLVRSALQRADVAAANLVVDTVERVQGQEREVVILSLAVGDPAASNGRGFFFSRNRLNVALSRARTKAVIVASAGAARALPLDPDGLRAASTLKALFHELPQVDLTPVYGQIRPDP